MGKLFFLLLLFSVVTLAPPPSDAPLRSEPRIGPVDTTSSTNDNESLSTANTECATARSIAGEGTFYFDNRGPVSADPPGISDCTNPWGWEFLNDAWYCWTSPCDGDVTVDTCGGTAVDTLLAVYSGCDCPVLAERKLACDDDGCVYQSRTTFQASAGEQFLIRLGTSPFDFAEGGTGTFTVSCGSAPTTLCSEPAENCQARSYVDALASDAVTHAVAENFTPSAGGDLSSICWWGTYFDGLNDCRIGAADQFEVRYFDDIGGVPGALIAGPFRQADGSLTVSGPGRPPYFWLNEYGTRKESDEQTINGLTSYAYSGTHATVSLLADSCYWIEITNRIGTACVWYWQTSDGGDSYANQDGNLQGVPDGHDLLGDIINKDLALCLGISTAARASCVSPPDNDACGSATLIVDGETGFSTRGASTDGLVEPYTCYGDAICCDFPLGDQQIHGDVWFDYQASCTGMVVIDVYDADFDSKIGVYPGDACPDTFGMTTCNDDAGPGLEFGSQVSFTANEFDRFKIRVGATASHPVGDCFTEHDTPGCDHFKCESQVCAVYSPCCTSEWSSGCVDTAFELCATHTAGDGRLEVRCVADPPDTSCTATPVQTLPAIVDASTTGSVHRCDLVPGSHTWIAFELCEASTVTLDYCSTGASIDSASDRLVLDCPCSGETGAATVSLCSNGNPSMTWDCLPPGIYYYPVLAQPGLEETFSIEITSNFCTGVCDGGTGDCCEKGFTAGCADSPCCESVCAVDPFCCQTQWDGVCAQLATLLCSTCPGDPCQDASGDCFAAHGAPGCNDRQTCEAICLCDPHCCSNGWDEYCAGEGLSNACGAAYDCNENGIVDVVDITFGASDDCDGNQVPDECEPDCNENGIADACDIEGCESNDCNKNDIPDECETDCNGNRVADACDISAQTSLDCNVNGVPDECDLTTGTSQDCNGNHAPDECDIGNQASTDCDQNTVPDECQDTSADCNTNGVWDPCDIAAGSSDDINNNLIPDECEPNRTFIVDDDADGDPAPGNPMVSNPDENGTLEHPFDSIQEAIDSSIHGDIVLVLDGTYSNVGNRDLRFRGKAIEVRSMNGPNTTTIDCESESGGVLFGQGETRDTVFQGFTIMNGNRGDGGAIHCIGSSPTIQNCVLAGNVGRRGGAVFCSSASPLIQSTRIVDNTATLSGGGVFCVAASAPEIRNCVIVENTATTGAGGGIYMGTSPGSVVNCTIVRNAAGGSWGGVTSSSNASIKNSIIWDNTPAEEQVGSPVVLYSDVEGGYAGLGNISTNPNFVDPENGDYQLDAGSPCVNAGQPVFDPKDAETDINGQDRVQRCRVDMGAYESAYYLDCDGQGVSDACEIADGSAVDCNLNGSPDKCDAGDSNGDGQVTVSDWISLAACLSGPCGEGECSPPIYVSPCCIVVDSDGDGDVDLLDVSEHQTRTTAGP